MAIGDRIRLYREALDMTMEELGRRCGTTKQTIFKYETGTVTNIPLPRIQQLADALHVTTATLLGWAEPHVSADVVTFDVLGGIAAGEYTHAGQMDAVMDKVDIPLHYLRGRPASDYFVLRVEGNSMYPLYMDGDLVLVLKTPTLQRSGQIGVIRHGEDATLKKIEFVYGEDWLKLIPLNPEYVPMTVSGADLEEWRVVGIPRMLIREIND